jgi:hypothetical protein
MKIESCVIDRSMFDAHWMTSGTLSTDDQPSAPTPAGGEARI